MTVDADTSLTEEVTEETSEPGTGSPSTPTPRRRRRRFLQVGAGLLGVIALIGLAVAGWGIYQFNQLRREHVQLSKAALDEPQNFLIVGSDTRELDAAGEDAGNIFGSGDIPGGRRSDTLVIARIDPTTTTAELLSIPRDLWVNKTDDSGEHRRINAAYSEGPQEVIDTIESELGIPIHHYVEINFNGFKDLVDAIGGVPMYFDRPVYDLNTGLNIRKKGCYTLDGVEALAYARSRHLVWSNGVRWITDESGDLGRISRQQVFMRHAAAKITTLGLDDFNTLRVLVAVAVNNVTVDDQLGTKDMLSISRQFSAFDSEQMVVHRLPTVPYRTDGGASVVLLDDEASATVLDIFSGRNAEPVTEATTTTIAPSRIVVDVFNATSTTGLAAKTSTALAAWGFTAGETGDEDSPGQSVLRYAPGSNSSAELVANLMTPVPKLVEDPTLAAHHLQVVVDDSTMAVVPLPDPNAPAAEGAPSAPVVDESETQVGIAPGDPPPGITCE